MKDAWPMLAGSERPPANWPGWPDNKKFAVVLTHDVEGLIGLDHCQQLIDLELEMGFRSSFNFVPEGHYRVSASLRSQLVRNGFEVGVHDFKHDGHLYKSRRDFKRNAEQINSYLQEWGAVGFRSGFMLRKLEWLHDLNIKYDASTFDTDPFEPQPDGTGTIFPFWVPRHSQGDRKDSKTGYVELPYTLPQDSTLFLLFGERTPDIWLRKADWIAENGGMILVNVHPDYVSWDAKTAPSGDSFPAANYRALLQHLHERYQGAFWHPLPRVMAEFIEQLACRPVNYRSKRVAMISYSAYLSDNRVRRYAEALAGRGDEVDVFALRRSPEMPRKERIEGVNVFRVQDRFSKSERSQLAFMLPVLRFLSVTSWRLTLRHLRRPYDLLHIHNMPDFLIFAAWYPKLTGARLILDIHDIVPEFFASKFQASRNRIVPASLRWMERVSAALADHVIIANHLWRDKYAVRTRTESRCSVFINHVDSKLFIPSTANTQNGKPIILYPGGLQWHQGVDIALRAFSKVASELPSAEFHIYGDGSEKKPLEALAQDLGLNGKVRFFQTRSVQEIAAVMADAALGVVPKRADSFGNEAYSTKIMEFMAVGVPVIVSDTKVDRFYFDDSVVQFFKSGDADDLARKMVEALRDRNLSQTMVARAAEYASRNCWETRKDDYLALVDSLCEGSNGSPEFAGTVAVSPGHEVA
jgi:glycosyltransferase involved in cell wall biosynthesis